MRATLLTLLLCLLTLNSEGQHIYQGRVTAEDSKKGLGWVSVVAENKEHKPQAFTRTREDGTFELKVPVGKEAAWLTFTLLSYAKQSIATSDFHNGQTVRMKEEALMLKEVKATSKRLVQRSDTLVYSVAGFRHKQDRTIADVIAKMPGLEVKQDGSIHYQGKPINNFYIEGLNLMGNNYSLASENINAAKVKSVEVLTNHQKIKALRGVQFSDQAALNLVLEEDAKSTWTGLVETGLGTTLQQSDADRLLRDGRLMGMMFGGKMQSLSMYKWNNTGRDIQREVRDLRNTIGNMSRVGSMTSGVNLSAPELLRERYTMNDSRLLATSWLHKAGRDATLRVQLNGLLDNTEGNRKVETAYSDAMGGTVITEDAKGETTASQWKGELKYERNGKDLFLSNVVSGYIDFDKSWANTMTNGRLIRQEASPRRRWVGDALEMVRTLGRDRVLRLNGTAVTSYLPGTLLLADSTSQRISQHATQASLSASFRHKLFGRIYISYQTGVDYDDQRFTVSRERETQSDSYRLLNWYLQPSLNIKRQQLEWTVSVPLRLVNRHLGSIANTRLIATPATMLRYQLLSQLTASASYSRYWQPATLDEMTSVPVYTSYRSYATGIGSLYANSSHNATLRLEYSDPVAGLFGNLNASWQCNTELPLYDNRLSGLVYHSQPSGEYTDNSIWMLSGRISKSLGSMKFIAAMDGQLTRSYSNVMMSGRKLPFRYDNFGGGISFSVRPLSTLSFEEESHYQYSRQVSTSDQSLNSRVLRSFTHKLKTFFMPGKWQIEWVNEMYHSNDESVSFTYFSDLQVSYRTKKWEAGMRMGNIFGNRQYERRSISTYYTSYSVTRLRPREVICKFSVDL